MRTIWIGGVCRENIMALRGRKMSGFAVVSGIFAAQDIEEETRGLLLAARELV